MLDLRTQYRSIAQEVETAIAGILESGRYIGGENVTALEKELAEYCGARVGIGVNSGTDALKLSLFALGIGPGDEVITSPFTFVAPVEVLCILGAKPVFADIDPQTFCLDPKRVAEKITPRTKAILPVHLYGHPADMTAIMALAEKHGLVVVEDACQAIGAKHQGRAAGTFGAAGCISFYPTKNLGAAGDGGMVITNDEALAARIGLLRNHGNADAYHYTSLGYNSRLDEIQAAILRIKLRRLAEWNEARRRNAARYSSLLASAPIITPVEKPGNYHIYHQYTVRTPHRDKLRAWLGAAGIGSMVYYPEPLHTQEPYRFLGYHEGDFPCAEQACREVVSLPIYPELTEGEIQEVCARISSFSPD